MIKETLKTIVGTKVLGSGFKVMSRKSPKAEIRAKYLFIYDSTALNENYEVGRIDYYANRQKENE